MKTKKFDPVLVTVSSNKDEEFGISKTLVSQIQEITNKLSFLPNSEFDSYLYLVKHRQKLRNDLSYIDINSINDERLFTSKQKLYKYLKFINKYFTDHKITFKNYKAN